MLKLRIPRLTASVTMRRAALAYLIIWVLSPPLAYGNGWRVLAVLAMLLWLALDTLSPRSVLRKPNWPVLCSLSYIIYTACIEWLVPDISSINQQFPIWIMLFFLLIGESQRRGNSADAQFCFWVILLIMPVWSYTTLWGIDTIASDVSRTMSRSSDEARELAAQGVGGFGYIYTTVLCVPFLAQMALRFRKEWEFGQTRWQRRAARLIIWVNFLLASLLMIRAGYTIALILWAFAVLSVMLIRSRRTLPFAISICFVGVLAISASIFMKPGLRALEVVAANTEYSAKIRDARTLLEEDQSTGTVNDRAQRYMLSLKLFVENPVIGTLTYDSLGKHSAILDRLGQYGFLFGFMFMALMIHVPVRVMRSSGAPVGLALSFLIVGVGFPMLNPVFMSWGLILFVFSRGALTVMGISMDHAGRMGMLEQQQRRERTAPPPMRRPQ